MSAISSSTNLGAGRRALHGDAPRPVEAAGRVGFGARRPARGDAAGRGDHALGGADLFLGVGRAAGAAVAAHDQLAPGGFLHRELAAEGQTMQVSQPQ